MPDIDVLARGRALSDYWRERDNQMIADRDRIYLVKDPVKTDRIKWYSNDPQVYYETACGLLSSQPLRFRLPLTINNTPEEKQRMNKAERFIIGIFRYLDRLQMSKGQSYWSREFIYWLLSGWYAVFVNVSQAKDKSVIFGADIWDPMTAYPRWEQQGLVEFVRTFYVDIPMAEMMVGEWKKLRPELDLRQPEGTKIRVVNYWFNDNGDIYNAIYFGDTDTTAGNKQEVKPLTKHPQFDHIPIFCGAIGIPDRITTGWQSRLGQNFIASARDVFDYENSMASLMATIVAETAYPNLVSKTKAGLPITKEGLTGYGQEIALKVGEEIELLKHAATPSEVNILLSWANQKKQRALFPDVVFGSMPFESSGFAISQLMAAIRYKVSPYLMQAQPVIGAIATEFLEQFKRKEMPSVKLSVVDPYNIRKGQVFMEEFSAEDVPENTYVEVTIPITSTLDKTQQILFAKQALTPPQLMSRETIWEDIFDIQDSDQEYARIIQDSMLDDPFLRDMALVEQMRIKEQAYREEGKILEADALKRYIQIKEMQLGMRKGIPTGAGEMGIPPEVMPPEMGMGALSPDNVRATMGVGPPGLRRRPQTVEERQKSKLYGPSGEPVR